MPRLKFTVDSSLLQELGERLVGKPHIALAELIKNSYDADAHQVTIELILDEDRIEIRDDGHGMDFEEFKNYWMRVGTAHKGKKRVSKKLNRTMTGSKGVGRLAVQILASQLKIITVPMDGKGQWLEATVDWRQAVAAKDLINASVDYKIRTSAAPFKHGTSIVLSDLKQEWDEGEIERLAGEIWWLQPPFHSAEALALEDRFHIDLRSTRSEAEETFDKQLHAIFGIWTAKLAGKNERGRVSMSLEFAGQDPCVYTYEIADFPHNRKASGDSEPPKPSYDERVNLIGGDFEIRIFTLQYRQPRHIRVGEARKYFWKHGGVHVYDGGFRLPYFGDPKNDWLQIEFDHAHRRFASELLPIELQKEYINTERLRYLPTLGRVFGVVNVNTSLEPNLSIMITRDRLTESIAFQDLVSMVRYAFDFYAYEEALRKYEQALRTAPTEPTSEKFERVEQVLEYYEPRIPSDVYSELRDQLRDATTAASASQEVALRRMGLLGPLATAGISALSYQHELRKQFYGMEGIVKSLSEIRTKDTSLRRSLRSLRDDLSSWLERARATNALFDYLADAENTIEERRFHAAAVIREVERQTKFLARGIEVDTSGVDDDLLLPEASLAEWGAIFQNVFTNAFNSMLDSEERLLQVTSRASGRTREVLVQDTGLGVDLQDSDRLFEPFERRTQTSPERRGLGYGGTGLGLTIVRLLAERIGCKVGFVEPQEGFSTAFSITWRETR